MVLTSFMLIVTASPVQSAYSIASESKLRTDLLTNYSVGVRPESTVMVQVSFQLTSINDVVCIRSESFVCLYVFLFVMTLSGFLSRI